MSSTWRYWQWLRCVGRPHWDTFKHCLETWLATSMCEREGKDNWTLLVFSDRHCKKIIFIARGNYICQRGKKGLQLHRHCWKSTEDTMLAIGLIHRCVTLEVKKMHTEGSPTRTSLYTSISLAPSKTTSQRRGFVFPVWLRRVHFWHQNIQQLIDKD